MKSFRNFLNFFKIQAKLFSFWSAISDGFEEINIGDSTVEIVLNKKIIIRNKDVFVINSEKPIVLNGQKIQLNPTKISSISKEELDKYNEVI